MRSDGSPTKRAQRTSLRALESAVERLHTAVASQMELVEALEGGAADGDACGAAEELLALVQTLLLAAAPDPFALHRWLTTYWHCSFLQVST